MTAIRTLFLHGVRERLANTNRLLLAGTVFLVPLVLHGFDHGAGGLPGTMPALWLALILGAGIIGQDAASGVLQLVLARPVIRLQYVLARWLAAAGLAAGTALAQTVLIAILLLVRGQSVSAGVLAGAAVAQVTTALGVTAVLAAFSAMVSGLGDIRFWVLGIVLGQVTGVVGRAREQAWLVRAGSELVGLMVPSIDPSSPGAGWPWFPLVQWSSTVLLSVVIATLVLNRKELSYGAS